MVLYCVLQRSLFVTEICDPATGCNSGSCCRIYIVIMFLNYIVFLVSFFIVKVLKIQRIVKEEKFATIPKI